MMRNRLISTLAVLAFAGALVIAGCGTNEKVIEPEPATEVTATPTPTVIPAAPTSEPEAEPTEELAPEPTKIQGPFADDPTYIEIELKVINLCNLDIPDLAIQNPHSEEWILLGNIPSDQVMVATFYWPDNEEEMALRVFNNLGEEYMTTRVKVKGLTKSVTITLEGENEIASVDATVE